jgi:hypothetical protein
MKPTALFISIALSVVSSSLCHASFINGKEDKRPIYVAGQPIPDMNGRKAELIPGAIPSRVRYMFSVNDTVNNASEILRNGIESLNMSLFKDSLMVQPGAFKQIKEKCALGSAGPKSRMIDPADIKKGNLDGGLQMAFVDKRPQLESIAKEMARLLKEDGGLEVRALKTKEMAKWWIYIGWDIEEPVFVVASKGGKFRFIVELNDKNQISILDELNGLP